MTALFPISEAWVGDPLHPAWDAPTPASVVVALSRRDRERRVEALVEQAFAIRADALARHRADRKVAAECVLFSGGDDSTALAHLFRSVATHAIHCNTTIGIEQTRQFVRDTCQHWGLPLLEEVAPTPYRDLVLERGFPGPALHGLMYGTLVSALTVCGRVRVAFEPGRSRCGGLRRCAQGVWRSGGDECDADHDALAR